MNLISKYGCWCKPFLVSVFFSIIFAMIPGGQFCCAEDVKLQWEPSASATVAGYKVYVKKVTENSFAVVDVGNATNYTARDLSKDTDYIFSVTAYDSRGLESSHSNSVRWSYRETNAQAYDTLIRKVLRNRPLRLVVALFAISIFVGVGILFYKRRKRKAMQ